MYQFVDHSIKTLAYTETNFQIYRVSICSCAILLSLCKTSPYHLMSAIWGSHFPNHYYWSKNFKSNANHKKELQLFVMTKKQPINNSAILTLWSAKKIQQNNIFLSDTVFLEHTHCFHHCVTCICHQNENTSV